MDGTLGPSSTGWPAPLEGMPATHALDQAFPLQHVARQTDDLAPPPRRDTSPISKLQRADRLARQSNQDASADRGWSAHGHTDPVRHDYGRSPSNVAAPAII